MVLGRGGAHRPGPLVPVLILLVLALGAGPAAAQVPLSTDRPGFGDGAALVPQRSIQVEAGYAYAKTGDRSQHSIGQVLARYGLFPNLELRVQLNSYVVRRGAEEPPETEDVSGVEDARLGVKIGLLHGPAPLTLIATTSVPSGANAFSANDPQPEVRLAGDLPLSPVLTLSMNAAYLFTLGEGDFDQAVFAASLGAPVPGTDGASAYVGYGGFFADGFDRDTHFLEGGLTYLLGDRTQVDVNAGIGLNGIRPEYFVGAGLVRRFDLDQLR